MKTNDDQVLCKNFGFRPDVSAPCWMSLELWLGEELLRFVKRFFVRLCVYTYQNNCNITVSHIQPSSI